MEMQGRVFGFQSIVLAVGMPLGMAVFGPLADRVSVAGACSSRRGSCSSPWSGGDDAQPGRRRAIAEVRAHEAGRRPGRRRAVRRARRRAAPTCPRPAAAPGAGESVASH